MAEKTCSHCVHVDVCENRFSWLDQEDNTKHIICHHFKAAADVVEVVRCGQCKHWKINPCNLYGGYCRYCDSAKIDHFCGYGERKEKTT